MLAYSNTADCEDKNFQISDRTGIALLNGFESLVAQKVGAQYLNQCPIDKEKDQVLEINKYHGFHRAFAFWNYN